MNYYQPNFYSNYPYGQYQSQAQQPIMTTQPQPQMGLQGKVVDGVDIVKVTDVPVGGYGVFPKADLTEVYIKTWNPNGTTNIMTFKPSAQEPTQQDVNALLLNKMQKLEEKLDAILKPAPIEQASTVAAAQTNTNTSTVAKRKEF